MKKIRNFFIRWSLYIGIAAILVAISIGFIFTEHTLNGKALLPFLIFGIVYLAKEYVRVVKELL